MRFLQLSERKIRNARNKVRRMFQNRRLKLRWNSTEKPYSLGLNGDLTGLERCKIVYVNLEHRVDRKIHIISEFKRIGAMKFDRLDAVFNQNGALGAAISHAQVLSSNALNDDELLMVCEDDCLFKTDRSEIDLLIEEFFCDNRLDVLCLAYNAKNGVNISENMMITSETATMSCYIVKSQSLGQVLESIQSSITKMSAGGASHLFAQDQLWKKLQKELFFAIPRERAAMQLPSFSDIENEYSDYGL